MKKMIFAFLSGVILASFAEEEEYISVLTGKPVPKDGKYTVEQIKARDQRFLKKFGGLIDIKASGPKALIVDSRTKATATLDEVARLYKLGTHLDIDVLKEPRGAVDPLKFAQKKMADNKALLTVVVVDKCADLPALSVFPEERIGLVNADRLKGGEDPSAPELRVDKETWRAIGFIGGLGFSPQENDMMQPIYTIEEIDANRFPFIQPMNMAKMQKFWKRFGAKKAQRTTYRAACQEGWAAAPTNDYQKAIWDEVHTIPSKPAKIKYEPKKTTPEKK